MFVPFIYTSYKNSKLATVISFIGSIFIIAAVLLGVQAVLEGEEELVGILAVCVVLAVLGWLITRGAKAISQRKETTLRQRTNAGKAISNSAPKGKGAKAGNKKKVGIILLVLQVVAVVSGISSGSSMFEQGIASGGDLLVMLGYFFPGILGIILIAMDGRKKEAADDIKAASSSYGTGAVHTEVPVRCSKCGTAAETGDVYCAHCGSKIKGN